LRELPYIPPKEEFEERVLTLYPHGTGQTGAQEGYGTSGLAYAQALLKTLWRPVPTMPPPLLTFRGIAEPQSACGCASPDTDGDVSPNHYVEAVNVSFKVFDKNGNTLVGPGTREIRECLRSERVDRSSRLGYSESVGEQAVGQKASAGQGNR